MRRGPAASRREAALLGLLVAASAVVYLLLNASRTVPDLMIDEILYGQMAQGVANGEGATWRGHGTGVQSAYSHLIAPGWAIGGDPVSGYTLGRSIGVVAACLTAVPAWMLGREVAAGAWRWVVPVGSVAGSWMVFSGRLLTENLAYPLATATLAALVVGLARGRDRRWLAAALALSIAACAVRMQLLILPLTVVAALSADIARTRGGRSRRGEASAGAASAGEAKAGDASAGEATATESRPGTLLETNFKIAAAVGLTAMLAGLLFFLVPEPASLLGRYRAAVDTAPDLATWIYWIANCTAELALMCGVVPAIALAALAARRANWRDPRAGVLLAVAVPFTLLLIAQVAWFSAADSPRLIDRYLVYAVPLLLAALATAPGRVDALRGVAAAIVIAGLVVVLPAPDGISRESDALLAAIVRFAGGGAPVETADLIWVAIFAGVAGVAGAVALAGGARAAPQWLALAVTAALLAVTAQHAWQIARAGAGAVATLIPQQRDWIDRAAARGETGPVALLSVGGASAEQGYLTEFFNEAVTGAYVLAPMEPPPEGAGFSCRLRAGRDGALSVTSTDPACEPPPRSLLARGETSGAVFAGEVRLLTAPPPAGRATTAVAVNAAVPRMRAVFDTGCGAFVRACRTFATLRGWLERPAEAVVTLRGGERPTRVRLGGETWPVPASREVTLEFKQPAGARVSRAEIVGRVEAERMPRVLRVELERAGGGRDTVFAAGD